MTNSELSLRFFLQLASLLAVSRIVGYLAKKIGQPQVVGEMITGIVLGPSLFGQLFPAFQTWLFPKASMPTLYVVSQLGLVLYMFLVGLEFNPNHLRKCMYSCFAVSASGIIVPLVLGIGLGAYLINQQGFFAPGVFGFEGMIFMGASMSITAFPMLARIIYENGLATTRLGTLVLASGAFDDVVAWCLLAIVLASFNHNASIAFIAIIGGILYTMGVFFVGRPFMSFVSAKKKWMKEFSGSTLSVVLMIVMLGASFTDAVGLYAVFGAFILGIAMPRGKITEKIHDSIGPITTNLLLPLFFIYSGLNTRLDLISGANFWGITLIVIIFAIIGKGVGCYLGARISGETNSNALAIGALMNARGLMELIILNIGLERKIITPTLFSIMVLMAVFTTLMATPLFWLTQRMRLEVNKVIANKNI